MGKKLDVGGQAIIEGVMMRGPSSMVIAVRRLDGQIVVKDSVWKPITRLKFLKWPLIRGATVMVEALMNGMQALSFSANVAMEDEEREIARKAAEADRSTEDSSDGSTERSSDEATELAEAEPGSSSALTKGAIALSMTISMFAGAGLFIYLPHAGAAFLCGLFLAVPTDLVATVPFAEWVVDQPLFHVVVGAIKMSVFVTYIALIRRMKDIRRVFQYHGAEHKSIHVYEADEELTLDNARKFPTFHPRCGTSFLVFVILISIFFFAAVFPLIGGFLPKLEGWRLILLQASIKLPMMVPIAGLSYEFIKWAGKRKDSPFMQFLSIPGRLVQKLTTIEPDDDQLEVALVSLKRALEHEGALDAPVYEGVRFLTVKAS
jgi:uncharacterized protein YqhQ